MGGVPQHQQQIHGIEYPAGIGRDPDRHAPDFTPGHGNHGGGGGDQDCGKQLTGNSVLDPCLSDCETVTLGLAADVNEREFAWRCWTPSEPFVEDFVVPPPFATARQLVAAVREMLVQGSFCSIEFRAGRHRIVLVDLGIVGECVEIGDSLAQ